RVDGDLAAVHGAVAGDQAVAHRLLLLHAEGGRAVDCQGIEFYEGTLVQQHLDTLAGGVLAARMLLLDGCLSTGCFGELLAAAAAASAWPSRPPLAGRVPMWCCCPKPTRRTQAWKAPSIPPCSRSTTPVAKDWPWWATCGWTRTCSARCSKPSMPSAASTSW